MIGIVALCMTEAVEPFALTAADAEKLGHGCATA